MYQAKSLKPMFSVLVQKLQSLENFLDQKLFGWEKEEEKPSVPKEYVNIFEGFDPQPVKDSYSKIKLSSDCPIEESYNKNLSEDLTDVYNTLVD